MGMMKFAGMMALTAALAACGGGSQEKAAADEPAPAALADGFYELSSEVTSLASTDNTTPATPLKVGDKQTVKACVQAGKPRPEMLAEHGQSPDKCELKNSYIRNGRMNAEMSCTREGKSGSVMPAMNGSFSKDAFEGNITTLTYFADDGDYRMSRKISARRVGDCPAADAAEKAG